MTRWPPGRCRPDTSTPSPAPPPSLDDAGRAELKDLQSAIVGSATTMPVEEFEQEMRQLERILSRDDGCPGWPS